MPVTTEKTVVARCDVSDCTAKRFGTEDKPPVGFRGQVERITDGPDGVVGQKVDVYACTAAHFKKAVVELLEDGDATRTVYGASDIGSGEDDPDA
jgi:hypothetical protein